LLRIFQDVIIDITLKPAILIDVTKTITILIDFRSKWRCGKPYQGTYFYFEKIKKD